MTVRCVVKIEENIGEHLYEFAVVPHAGESTLLPGWEAIFDIIEVQHMPRRTRGDGPEPYVYLKVRGRDQTGPEVKMAKLHGFLERWTLRA